LLQLRTIERYYSNTVSIMLYEVAYAQMVILLLPSIWPFLLTKRVLVQLLASLQYAKRPPISVHDVVSVRQRLRGPYHESNTHVTEMIWKEAQLHATWHEWKHGAPLHADRRDLLDMLQSALDLDVECQTWERSLPEAWKYQAVPNLPASRHGYASIWQQLVLEGNRAPAEIHTYSNLKRCCVWGSYRTSRMFLLRDTLEILNWMLKIPEATQDISSSSSRMDSAHLLSNAERTANDGKIISLDDLSLRVLHTSTTTHMVNLIEEGCSAVVATLTVLVDRKSQEDVTGIRGYTLLWPLATMDSILSSGLVPNRIRSTNPSPTPSSTRPSPPLQSAPPTIQTWTLTESAEHTPPRTHPRHRHSTSLPHTSTQSSPSTQPSSSSTVTKPHVFDCAPRHPYDRPTTLPSLVFNVPEPKSVDVAARREWLNGILYYIGSELGIKKALAVPLMEGYVPVVKPRVDGILGR
jgi:hypothetical protein